MKLLYFIQLRLGVGKTTHSSRAHPTCHRLNVGGGGNSTVRVEYPESVGVELSVEAYESDLFILCYMFSLIVSLD